MFFFFFQRRLAASLTYQNISRRYCRHRLTLSFPLNLQTKPKGDPGHPRDTASTRRPHRRQKFWVLLDFSNRRISFDNSLKLKATNLINPSMCGLVFFIFKGFLYNKRGRKGPLATEGLKGSLKMGSAGMVCINIYIASAQ